MVIDVANTAARKGGRFDSAGGNIGRCLWSCPPQTGRRGFASAAAFFWARRCPYAMRHDFATCHRKGSIRQGRRSCKRARSCRDAGVLFYLLVKHAGHVIGLDAWAENLQPAACNSSKNIPASSRWLPEHRRVLIYCETTAQKFRQQARRFRER
jgi:hypothetical protein